MTPAFGRKKFANFSAETCAGGAAEVQLELQKLPGRLSVQQSGSGRVKGDGERRLRPVREGDRACGAIWWRVNGLRPIA
jgi:hypothetical protein